MIGDAIGGVLANALGVDATPEAVDHAINTTPAGELAAKLSAAEAEAVAMWQALPKIAKAHAEAAATVNDTMRAELAAGRPWHHWRNLWGFSCVAQVSVASALFAWFMASGNWQAMNALAQHSGMLLTYFGMQLSVLGVVTNARAREDHRRDRPARPVGHRADRQGGAQEMTSEDTESIAKVAGKEAALQTLIALGIDVANPTETQADFIYLRRWRKLIETITSALILAGVVSFSGVLATLVYAGFRITIR